MVFILDKSSQVTIHTLQRMPYYLQVLQKAEARGVKTISAVTIADELGMNSVLVRKEIAAVSTRSGKPKAGFEVAPLIRDIEDYMGFNNEKKTVIVGAGSLGRALLGNSEFSEYGIHIVAAFDVSDAVIGRKINGIEVYPVEDLEKYCTDNSIPIGIITTPVSAAQRVADALVRGGVKAIWNFAQTILNVPEGTLVQNENLASSLVLLSRHINK